MANIPILDEAHWHAIRRENVGASEVAALFGESPWVTPFSLWHQKKGSLPPEPENESMRAGRHFEPAVASLAKEVFGYNLRKVRRYITCDDTPGLGCSVDYELVGTDEGLPPVELKWSLWGDGWEIEGDDIVDAPIHYQLQVQAQLACKPRAAYGLLIAATAKGIARMVIEPRPKTIAAIKRRVTEFWGSIRANTPPDPLLEKDARAVIELNKETTDLQLRLDDDEEAALMCEEYLRLAGAIKDAQGAQEAMRAAFVLKLGLACRADVAQKYRISAPTIAENEGTLVTPEMVGTRIGARKSFRMVRVTMPKPKKGTKDAAAAVAAKDAGEPVF